MNYNEKKEFGLKFGLKDNFEWNDRNLVLANSVMGGIFRSLWIVLLETNQGALRMDRKTLNWNLCTRAMFEAFADPHTSISER